MKSDVPAQPFARALLVCLLVLAGGVAACDDGVVDGPRRVPVQVAPRLSPPEALPAVAAQDDPASMVNNVRIVFRRDDGTVAVDTIVEWPLDQDTLRVEIELEVEGSGETFSFLLEAREDGTVLFKSEGDLDVGGGSGTSAPPSVTPELEFQGPGAEAQSVEIRQVPDALLAGARHTLVAVALDGDGDEIEGAPFVWTSLDEDAAAVEDVDDDGRVTAGVRLDLDARIRARVAFTDVSSDVAIPIVPEAVELESDRDRIRAIGAAAQLTARALGADGVETEGGAFDWSVAEGADVLELADIAGPSARAVARKSGTGAVAVVVEGLSARAELLVKQVVSALSVSGPEDGELTAGETVQLDIDAEDPNGNAVEDPDLELTSSDDDVVEVDDDGNVTGMKAGTATVTVEAVGESAAADVAAQSASAGGAAATSSSTGSTDGVTGSETAALAPVASIELTVVPGAAGDIEAVSGDGQTGEVGKELGAPLVVRVTDDFGNPVPGVTVSFAVTDGGGSVGTASVATDADGEAQTTWTLGGGAGSGHRLRASAPGAGSVDFRATGTPGPAASVTLEPSSVELDAIGDMVTLKAAVEDAFGNELDAEPAYSSGDDGVATVEGTGKVTARGNGTTEIEAKVGSVTGTATVIVKQAVAAVEVTPESASLGGTGDMVQLTAKITDANGVDVAGASATWSSADESVATVDGTGKVTAAGAGSTRITAAAGGKSDDATITVGQKVATVEVTPASLGTLAVGQEKQLTATAKDANGDVVEGASFSWSSTDELVVKVNQSGLAKGVGPGSASVLATTSDQVADIDPGGPTIGGRVAASLGPAGAASVQAQASLADVAGSAAVTVEPEASRSLAVSDNLSCVLDTGGAAHCWGLPIIFAFTSGFGTPDETPAVDPSGRDFTSISGGGGHMCALDPSGAAFCGGENGSGQLGDGTTTDRDGMTAVTGGHSFAWIDAGVRHTCGVTDVGDVRCWGHNGNGQLGDGGTSGSNVPIAVSSSETFKQVVGGLNHTCALTTGGSAYCWGLEGRLGNGSDATDPAVSGPVPVSGGHTFIRIDAGDSHTCGLTSAGELWCWGLGGNGQLGDGDFSDEFTPVMATGSYKAFGAEVDHTCAIVGDGSGMCWGDNGFGQLGDGTLTASADPVPVSGGLSFLAIAPGFNHSCGLTADGVYCWGDATFGSLGDGTPYTETAPVAVSGLTPASEITAGRGHSCGIDTSSDTFCWGRSDSGQLGAGTFDHSPTPTAVSAPSSPFVDVDALVNHNCALTGTGETYCWGRGTAGQLGDGTTTNESSPVSNGLPDQTDVSAGGGHSCGVASSTFVISCWGSKASGQIGDGTTGGTELTPTQLGSITLNEISAGGSHTCGLDTVTDEIFCWGENGSGQLGLGDFTDTSAPTSAVTGGTTPFSELSAGGSHTCAIESSDLTAQCWGSNGFGQLGDGGTTDSSTPVSVGGGAMSFSDIEAGEEHTCALKSNGDLYCWGDNTYGELGNGREGPNEFESSPVLVAGGIVFSDVAVGRDHTCAIEVEGGVHCWGYKSFGRLGDGSEAFRKAPGAVANGFTTPTILLSRGVSELVLTRRASRVPAFGLSPSQQRAPSRLELTRRRLELRCEAGPGTSRSCRSLDQRRR